MGEDAAWAESAYRLSPTVTGSALPATSDRTNSEAAGATVVSRQPSSHPGMLFAPTELRAKRAERIRGGCCVCPGGGCWVVCGADRKDDEHVEQRQRELRMRAVEDARSFAPPQPVSALQPVAESSRSSQPSKSTKPSSPPLEPQVPQPTRGKRPPAKTLPPQTRPDLPVVSRQAGGGRAQSLTTRLPPSLP